MVAQSAGTSALVGEPVVAPMAALLGNVGVSATQFEARRLTPPQVRDADLVLAMSREHRGAAVEAWPGAVRRSFTINEFARLLLIVDAADISPGTPGERLQALVPLAASLRRPITLTPDDDDIADPYGQTDVDYRRAFEEIHAAVQTIAGVVLPSS